MPVVIGGWDSPESFLDAIERGEVPNPNVPLPSGIVKTAENTYVHQPDAIFPPYLATADKGSSLQNSIFGTVQNAVPGVMLNTISGGVWSGFNPNDMAGSLAALHAFALAVYGSIDLGTVRYSSEVLENEPTGVRPGTMERIVIPAWARRERGSPL